MIIDKKLNLDKELEYFTDGSMSFAQNVIVSQDGLSIQNEPAIVNFLKNEKFDLAGFIACNEEFVLFSKTNDIVRIKKDGTKSICDVKWSYCGGEVFGTFTYNVNNELIIAISERNSTNDCPLKVINLDRDAKLNFPNDNLYTLTPDIPQSNMIDVEYVLGDRIKKGKYNFFIKYFINDDYETAWFPIGIPVFVYDNVFSDTSKTVVNHRIQAVNNETPPTAAERYFVSYSDFYNNDDEYTNNNIKLKFEINTTVYTHYKIGYIINRQSSSEGRSLSKHSIKDTTVIVNGVTEPVSIDELTIGQFNLYNVNTMCNYKNRLYLANYKEENRNADVYKIDTSGIKVFYDYYESNIPEISSNGDIKDLNYSQLKNQWKPKPGRAAIYNFFIHYVYPNGNYTDGIPITNISDYEDLIIYGNYTLIGHRIPTDLNYTANTETLTDDIYNAIQEAKTIYGDTSIYELYIDESLESFCKENVGAKWFDVKYQWVDKENSRNVGQTTPKYLVSLENYINTNGDILYLTPITKSFNASKLYFTGIKMYPEFVGYFISYEKPEYINVGEGLIIPAIKATDNIISRNVYDLFDINNIDNISIKQLKFYYPEFNIVGGDTNINKLIQVGNQIFDSWNFPHLDPSSWNDDAAYDPNNTLGIIGLKNDFEGGGVIHNVEKINIISPDSNNNMGKEGYLEVNTTNNVTFEKRDTLQMYLGISNNKNVYLSKNKKLISLGYTKFQQYETDDLEYSYGYEDVIYNYDFYRCYSSIIFFDKKGIVINETESNPLHGNGVKEFYSYDKQNPTTKAHIGIIKFWHETHYPLFLKEINQSPTDIFYSYWRQNVFQDSILDIQQQYRNLILSPKYVNDLYKLDASYYDYTGKILVNWDKNLISNQIETYINTVRRSDVIQSESIVNSWRFFRPENYKIITEDKGAINNVVGIGNYLFAHCEHSLFLFDITDSLQALDKNVQLLQPDSFEVAYKEVFTADKGYGGLQDHVSWICDEFGYVFFDRSAKKIYRFDGGQLKDITEGIDRLIKGIATETIFFGNDRPRNRIMANIRGDDNVILSYNLVSGGWVSTHSYVSNYRFIGLKDKLFLLNVEGSDLTVNHYLDTEFNKYSLPVGNIDNDGSAKSFIDVVFANPNYNKIKVLDFITYILNKEPANNFELLQLEIFTNCCYSGVIDISQERKKVSEYKKPYYDFERWNFNYFRNVIDKIENGEIVDRLSGRIHSYPQKVQRGYDNALISGKYVVIRFSFKLMSKQVNVKDIHAYFKP